MRRSSPGLSRAVRRGPARGGAAATLLAPLLLLLLGSAGCAALPPLPDREGAGGDPRASEERVLATLARDLEGFRTLRASVTGDAPAGSFSGAVFVDRERRAFRLYAWKLGGAVAVFDMLVDGGVLRLLVPRSRRVLVRPVAEEAPAAPGDAFPLEALVRALLGTEGAVTRTARRVEAFSSETPAAYVVTERRLGRDTARFDILGRSLAVLSQSILGAGGEPLLEIAYGDHEALPGGRVIPRRLRVRRPADPADRELDLRFDEIAFDVPLEGRKFEMRLPPGTVEVARFADLEVE
jgi:hypothetical protein